MNHKETGALSILPDSEIMADQIGGVVESELGLNTLARNIASSSAEWLISKPDDALMHIVAFNPTTITYLDELTHGTQDEGPIKRLLEMAAEYFKPITELPGYTPQLGQCICLGTIVVGLGIVAAVVFRKK
jgi:hypothetical protein